MQAYYTDILKTDNHGERIDCDGSTAFFDSARTGSYEDYIFTGIEAEHPMALWREIGA